MIARNEEALLGVCLESVRGLVDEIVLVDTGSTDATPELARLAGDVVSVPWSDDFSAPRNEALAHAQGDWILQLDADERLGPHSKQAVREAIALSSFDCGMLG